MLSRMFGSKTSTNSLSRPTSIGWPKHGAGTECCTPERTCGLSFAEAVEQDFLLKDPARTVKTPSELKETDKTTLTWDQLRAALSMLPLRDWILLKLDMSNALRPGELFGLRWSCFDPKLCLIEIKETAYKGKIRPWGKTKGSLTKIPIAQQLAEELQAWREQCREEQQHKKRWDGPTADAPEAFIFPGRHGGFIDSSNYRKRVLHKVAKELGLPKLTFQVIRRTIATLAKDKGHVKDIQGMMRHSRLATTTEVYMQSLEDGVRTTVNSIHDELSGTLGIKDRRGRSRKQRTASRTPRTQ